MPALEGHAALFRPGWVSVSEEGNSWQGHKAEMKGQVLYCKKLQEL